VLLAVISSEACSGSCGGASCCYQVEVAGARQAIRIGVG
jgi:hypothetical protein